MRTVYILGAGASCCTDAYVPQGCGIRGPLAPRDDYRPPAAARFFKVALERGAFAHGREGLKVPNLLKPLGITVEGLAQGQPPGANVETVLSLVDLVRRLLGDRLDAADACAPPSEDVRRLCAMVQSQPIFGDDPAATVDLVARDMLRRAQEQAREGRGNIQSELGGAYLYALQTQGELLDAIKEVYAPTEPYRSGKAQPCSNYGLLYERLHPGDTVITFNYDFLLDRVLEDRGNLRCEGGHPLPTLFDAGDGQARYLKLHGSALWYVQYVGKQTEERFTSAEPVGTISHVRFTDRLGKVAEGEGWLPAPVLPQHHATISSPKQRRALLREPLGNVQETRIEPLIIPPTVAKDFSRPEVKRLRCAAKDALSKADEICVIGYSLPPTDCHVTEMIRSAGKKRPPGNYSGVPVRIVNKCSDDQMHSLRGDLRNAFPAADLSVECNDGFDQWVKRAAV